MSDWSNWREDRDFGRREERDYGRRYADEGGRRRADEARSFRRDPQSGGGDRGWAREPEGGYRFGRRDPRFSSADQEHRVPREETDRLIASDKVEGTPVYSRDGERLGRIENFMVGKRSGHVEYAVMSFGGMMRMGERHYPLPWDMLTYDEGRGGYVVDITERDLERAPSHRPGEAPRFGAGYGADIRGYYGVF